MVAVSVADCAVDTEATLAVNVALEAVAGTVTDAGTDTELLLLDKPTVTPPVGAEPESVTVHESDNDPVSEVVPHVNPLTVGARAVPVPLKLTVAVEAVLAIESCPETELAVVG